jgi:hypothetical protein
MTDTNLNSWITDTEISTRFPYYTRANADEVGPEPFSPLGWSLGWMKGCIPGVANGFVAFGVVEPHEFAVDPPEVFGNWGGYFYNQLSLPRVMGVRMPGASPEAIDLAYFGDHPGVPPYTPHPDDENEAQSAKLGETMGWAMSTRRNRSRRRGRCSWCGSGPTSARCRTLTSLLVPVSSLVPNSILRGPPTVSPRWARRSAPVRSKRSVRRSAVPTMP